MVKEGVQLAIPVDLLDNSSCLRAISKVIRSVTPWSIRLDIEMLRTNLSDHIEDPAGLGRTIEDIEEYRNWKAGPFGRSESEHTIAFLVSMMRDYRSMAV